MSRLIYLYPLHSKQQKFYGVLAALSAIGLKRKSYLLDGDNFEQIFVSNLKLIFHIFELRITTYSGFRLF